MHAARRLCVADVARWVPATADFLILKLIERKGKLVCIMVCALDLWALRFSQIARSHASAIAACDRRRRVCRGPGVGRAPARATRPEKADTPSVRAAGQQDLP